MTLLEALRFAQKFAALGTAVQEQFTDVAIHGEALEEQNPNALKALLPLLAHLEQHDVPEAGDLHREITELLDG